MASTLRELLLGIKIKVDKEGVAQVDATFDRAAKSAQRYENAATRAIAAVSAKARAAFKRLPSFNRPDQPAAASETAAKPGLFSSAREAFSGLGAKAKGALEGLGAKAKGALESAGSAVTRFNSKFDGVATSILSAKAAFAAFAVVIVGSQIARFFGEIIDGAGELHDMSQRTRVSVESLQVWRAVAADAGVDAGAVEGSFRKLNKSMAAAGRGAKLQASAFKDLGVEVKDSSGRMRPIEEVLIDTGSALAGMEDDAKATALATQLLGPAGMGLVPAFKDGAAAVRKLTDELKENVSLNAGEAARLDDVGDALARGSKKWGALKNRLAVALLPVLEKVAGAFEGAMKWILRMSKETSGLLAIISGIGIAGLVRFATAIGAWYIKTKAGTTAMALLGGAFRSAAGFMLKMIMPMLVLEDFLVFLSGGKSVFGRAMEEIFGSGGAKEKREQFLSFFTSLKEAIGPITDALAGFVKSPLFTGAVKTALDAVLAVLNLIGVALSDNETKSREMAERAGKHLGIDLSVTRNPEAQAGAMPGTAGRAAEAANADSSWQSWIPGLTSLRKRVQAGSSGFQEDAAHNAAVLDARKNFRVVPPPNLPTPNGKAPAPITITDQRKVEVHVSSNAPGETGRAVAGSVTDVLTKDRRQTLIAVGG